MHYPVAEVLMIYIIMKIENPDTLSSMWRSCEGKTRFCAHRKNNFDSKWDLYVARKDALL